MLVREYIDDGYSGTLLDRPALNQLRADLKTDVFDTVYFLAADRIARDAAHQTIIVGELLKHGKQIIIDGKDYEQNPENKLTLTMLGAFAEFERAKIIERTTRGAASPAAHGRIEQYRPPHLRIRLREEDIELAGLARHQRGAGRSRPLDLRDVREWQLWACHDHKHGRAISGRKWAGLITGSKGGVVCALA